jgi:predicted N-acetyltransferase YhbS
VWVSPEHIGAGIGRALFDHAVRRAAALGAATLIIEADPNAEGFYRRMGARRVGENVYEIEGHRRELPLLILDVPRQYRAV